MSAPLAFTVLALIPWPAGSAKIEDGVENRAPVDFAREVRPILSDKCFQCHGPDSAKRKGDLRLDVREVALKGGDSGTAAIVPHDAGKSPLIGHVSGEDDEMR